MVHLTRLPGAWPVACMGVILAAYSCVGSPGIGARAAPGSLFVLLAEKPEVRAG